jgi:hypothetical protein
MQAVLVERFDHERLQELAVGRAPSVANSDDSELAMILALSGSTWPAPRFRVARLT